MLKLRFEKKNWFFFETVQLIFETKLSEIENIWTFSICGCHFRAFLSQDVRPKAVIGMQWI